MFDNDDGVELILWSYLFGVEIVVTKSLFIIYLVSFNLIKMLLSMQIHYLHNINICFFN